MRWIAVGVCVVSLLCTASGRPALERAPAPAVAFAAGAPGEPSPASATTEVAPPSAPAEPEATGLTDPWSALFVFVLATFIGLGVIRRVSRLLHTPLMSMTNAISAIAVIGSILVTGGDYPPTIRILGAVALFASTTNIVSGFLITDSMLKMFKQKRETDKP